MITRYLLSIKWRKKAIAKIPGINDGGWVYAHVIDNSPVDYLLKNDSFEEQHVIINSHKLTDAEYERISAIARVEDYTRDD